MKSAIDLMLFMGDLGLMYKKSEVLKVQDYISKMVQDDRVIMISDNDKPYGVIFFSMTNNPDRFLRKGTWDYVPHFPQGDIVYVEKLIAKLWNRTMRLKFEEEIIRLYPSMMYGIWHKYATFGDRKVKSPRRIKHVRNQSFRQSQF